MEEFFDMYDENGSHIGVWPKSRAHTPDAGAFHKAVHIWFVNNAGGGGRILVQKRSAAKKQSPNKWDIPSAGHVNAGEDCLTACVRETQEELGIKLPKSKFKFQCERVDKKPWEFSQHYLVKCDIKTEDMTLDPREVAEIKWFSLPDFEKLLYSDDFVAHSKDYKDTVLGFITLALVTGPTD